jgi:phosphoribosyl-AMP cyclohydrolase
VSSQWLEVIRWNEAGLLPVIAQDADSGRVSMLAWMNREALAATANCGEAVYWSRSRQRLWHKGETSGNVQKIKSIRLDCDQDALLLEVEQMQGIACHTGRQSCFFQRLSDHNWQAVDPVLRNPDEMYGS